MSGLAVAAGFNKNKASKLWNGFGAVNGSALQCTTHTGLAVDKPPAELSALRKTCL